MEPHSVSFCTTATLRPEVLQRTYESFSNHLRSIRLDNTTLFLNVDPVPRERLAERDAVVRTARRFFGCVVTNMPASANFAAAVNWCWSKPDTEYLFLLEDDWILLQDVDIENLIAPFRQNAELLQVILRAYPYTYKKLVLSPSIVHRRLYAAVAGRLSLAENPETQLRNAFGAVDLRNVAPRIRCIPDGDPIVKDIGREWLRRSALRHPPEKTRFTAWEKRGPISVRTALRVAIQRLASAYERRRRSARS